MSNVVMVLMDGVNGWSGGKLHDINKAGLVISEERCRQAGQARASSVYHLHPS
jgi:hypothetical protein